MRKTFCFLFIFLSLSACEQGRVSERTVKRYLDSTFWINNSYALNHLDSYSRGKGQILYFDPEGHVRTFHSAFRQEGDSIRLAGPLADPSTGQWLVQGRQVEILVPNAGGLAEAGEQRQGSYQEVFQLQDNLLVSQNDTFTLARNLESRVKAFLAQE